MSEKIQIDLAINNANAASSLKETRLAIKDLQNAALNLEQGSPGFNKLISKAGELKDRINDVQDTTKVLAGNTVENLSNSFARMSSSAVGGLQAIIGLQTAFGDQSKATIQTLAQLQGLMAFTSGIKEFANLGQSVKDFSTVISVTISKLTTKTVAQQADTVATVAGTEAQVASNLAMAASPVGLLVIGLMAAAGAYLYFSNKSEESRVNSIENNKIIRNSAYELTLLQIETQKSADKLDLLNGKLTEHNYQLKGVNEELDKNILASNEKAKNDEAAILKDKESNKIIQEKIALQQRLKDIQERLANPRWFQNGIVDMSLNQEKRSIQDQLETLNKNPIITQFNQIQIDRNNRNEEYKKNQAISIDLVNEEYKNKLKNLDSEIKFLTTINGLISTRNEYSKKSSEIEANKTRDTEKLKIQFPGKGEEYEKQLSIINKRYQNESEANEQARQDKANQLRLENREIRLNIDKEGYLKTVDIINNQYNIEKQLLKDKLDEDIRLNEGNGITIDKLNSEYALKEIQLEKNKNNILLQLAQENANRTSFIINSKIQGILNKGGSPIDYISKLESSTRTQAESDFAASDSGKKLSQMNKFIGARTPEQTKQTDVLLDEQDAFINDRLRGIQGLVQTIKIAGVGISETNTKLYDLENTYIKNIQNMTIESFKKYQDEFYKYKTEQLHKNMEAELIAAGENERRKAEIRSKYALDETKLKKEQTDQNIQLEINQLNSIRENVTTGLQGISDIYDLFADQRDSKDAKSKAEEEKRAKDRFYIHKALSLSMAVVQGYINTQAAWKQVALASALEKPLAIASAVATTVQSAVTVAKIASSEYKSTQSSSGGNNASSTQQAINLYGQGGNQNNLTVGNQNQRDRDIRVYVVESDIATANSNISRYKTSVQLG